MIKDNFVGRKAYLDILQKRVSGLKEGYRQNVAIIGDELVGKTSIIHKFLDNFYDNRMVMLYIETRPESLASFSRRFIGTLLYNFLTNSGTPLKEDVPFLVGKSEKFIPKTVEKIRFILDALEKRKKNNIFIELVSLCEMINQETGKYCVVILDEFHNLENMGIKNLYPDWSKLLITQKTTLYILISSMKFKARAILSKDLSLLFGNFEIITVEPFDSRASEAYLGYRLQGIDISDGLKNFIVNFTGGSPFYMELITKEFLESGPHDLIDILEALLFEPSGALNQKFSNYLKHLQDQSCSQDNISILHLVSCAHNRVRDVAHLMHKTKKELDPKISRLLELDCLCRSGDFLKISDRVFGFWLKFVYQEKLHSLTFDAKNQKALFRANIQQMINEFILSTNKTMRERMQEVLHMFANDSMQIEKKRLKLNSFREIKPLEFNKRGLREGLVCRSNDSIWVMGFKHDMLTEEDVAEFAQECKKYRHKLQRKIIVAFEDIDANTRLRALEEKIWTWDLNNLNQIMDLFSRPRVVV